MHTIVAAQQHQLYERALIGGQFGMFPFAQTIYWVRKSEAEVVLRHGGVELKRWAGYVDLSGEFLSCVEAALSSYEEACKYYGITRGSTLQAVIRVTITDVPHAEAAPAAPGAPHGPLAPIDPVRQWSIKVDSATDSYRPLAPVIIEAADALVSTIDISAPVRTRTQLKQFVKRHRKMAKEARSLAMTTKRGHKE